MRLDRLLDLVPSVEVLESHGDLSATEVGSIALDSREVIHGALFCAVPGTEHDGHDFAIEAVASGATAVLCERLLPIDIGQVRVRAGSIRQAMAQLSAALHGFPARSMQVLGVTGTNGKTTVTHMLESVLESNGWSTGVVGTLGGPRTTPEAPELQAMLAGFLAEGRRSVAMEVSSHALAQHRVDGIRFSVVSFTNLSQDHLDFHGTMEAYFEAKAQLFSPVTADRGVIDSDDRWGRRLIGTARIPVATTSLADAGQLEVGITSSRFQWRGRRVNLAMGGRFNVRNALIAATMAEQLGIEARVVARGLSSMAQVSGRMEPVSAGQPFTIIVDYAHTPAGLEQVLEESRRASTARVIVVFGCGGDRDRAKRPKMGAVAARMADVVVLTSDNPRGEDPRTIMAEVKAGVGRPERLVEEPDRATAIALALGEGAPGDVVVVAGKGHESSQQLKDRTIVFDDREVVRSAVARLGAGR